MKFKEIIDMVNSGCRPFVEFKSKIEQNEGYIDVGMRAKIIQTSLDDPLVVKITFDVSLFEIYNDSVEKHNYWDKNGNATLSAKEAGWYPEGHKEDYFFMVDDDVEEYFTFYKSNMDLYERYLLENNNQSYTEWLEDIVMSFKKKREVYEDC